MEGKGFEPTIEALFGKNGFFPDTMSKAMYWTGDKMPEKMVEVLENWGMSLKSDKQVRDASSSPSFEISDLSMLV